MTEVEFESRRIAYIKWRKKVRDLRLRLSAAYSPYRMPWLLAGARWTIAMDNRQPERPRSLSPR